jgi:hypothetical protein
MVATNSLPNMGMIQEVKDSDPLQRPEGPDTGGAGSHLRIVK